MFTLLMIDQFLKHSQHASRARYLIALFAMILAVLSKPGAVVAPAIAAVLAIGILRRSTRSTLFSLFPMFAIAIACIIWSRAAQPSYDPTWTPLWTRPLIAADAIAFYLCKLFVPVGLALIYGRTPRQVVSSGAIYYTWLLPAIAAVIVWQLRRSGRWLICAALVFVIALAPVLGFARFMFQIHSTVADHYMYLPMLGPAIALTWFACRWQSRAVLFGFAVVIVLLAGVSVVQIGHWHDSIALFRHSVEVNPRSATAYSNLGVAFASAGRMDDALPCFEHAVALSPDNRLAHTNLARAY